MEQKKKLTKRQAQAIQTKENIYKVFIRLIEKKGFSNVTVEEISEKAGVSVGTFYHYYKSKNDIFIEIFKQGDDYFKEHVKKELKEGNALDRIVEFFKYYAIFNSSNGIDFIQQLFSTRSSMFNREGGYMQTLLQEIIREGQERKEISIETSPEEITRFMFISVRGLVYDWCLHIENDQYDLEEAILQYTKRLVTLFKP